MFWKDHSTFDRRCSKTTCWRIPIISLRSLLFHRSFLDCSFLKMFLFYRTLLSVTNLLGNERTQWQTAHGCLKIPFIIIRYPADGRHPIILWMSKYRRLEDDFKRHFLGGCRRFRNPIFNWDYVQTVFRKTQKKFFLNSIKKQIRRVLNTVDTNKLQLWDSYSTFSTSLSLTHVFGHVRKNTKIAFLAAPQKEAFYMRILFRNFLWGLHT